MNRRVLALILLLAAYHAFGQENPDPIGLYNQACRLSLAGDGAGALAAFRSAMDAGFDDLDFALTDPDLELLRRQDGFPELIQARTSTLRLAASEKGMTLTSGRWTPFFDLHRSGVGRSDVPAPRMRIRWQPVGLDFELELAGSWADLMAAESPAPWNGGHGLVVTLAIPENDSSFASRSWFVLAFGLEKSSPAGGIFLDSGAWQRVLELDPEIHIDGQAHTLVMTGSIPWQSIRPFHPLVDTRLGFNAALRVRTAGGFRKAEFFPDPRAFSPPGSRRRFVPLDFAAASATRESLVGRMTASLCAGDSLGLVLAAVSSRSGTGTLSLDFTDNRRASVVPGGATSGPVHLDQGFNRLEMQADFSALKPGLYTVRAEIVFPSGRSAVWNTRVLKLGDRWRDQLAGKVASLPEKERRTGQYYLRAVTDAVDGFRNRFDPGPLARTLSDLDQLLQRAAETGTLLPASGTVLLVYPGPGDQDRLCTLYLPEGYRKRGPVNPVLVLMDFPGAEGRLVQRLARSYEYAGYLGPEKRTTTASPVYLVPPAVPATGNDRDQDLAEAEAALDWALDFFATDKVSVCGVDSRGGPALQLAHDRANRLRGLQIVAGGRLEPWPGAGKDFLVEQLGPAPAHLPVSWLDFVQESRMAGQGPLLLEVLRDLGYRLDVQTVAGGVSITQIADRTVLWAESLP